MIPSEALKKQRIVLSLLLLLTAAAIAVGLSSGYSSLSWDRLLPTFLGHGTFQEHFVLFSIRLPRIIITLLSGMALALSGAILQGITRAILWPIPALSALIPVPESPLPFSICLCPLMGAPLSMCFRLLPLRAHF